MHLKAKHVFFQFIMSTSLDLNSKAIVRHLKQDGVNHEDCRVNQQKFMILSNFFTLWAKISPLAPTSLIFRHANNFWRYLRCSIRPSGNNLCVACTIYNPKPSSRFYGRMHSSGYPWKSIKINGNRGFEQIFHILSKNIATDVHVLNFLVMLTNFERL